MLKSNTKDLVWKICLSFAGPGYTRVYQRSAKGMNYCN